jgi:DNA-binding MarR family transcriptional regulator
MPPHRPEMKGALVRETFRAMVTVEHQFDDTELMFLRRLALNLVDAGRIACIGDVHRELGIASGAAARLVDQLARKALLARARSVVERRVLAIALVPGARLARRYAIPSCRVLGRGIRDLYPARALDSIRSAGAAARSPGRDGLGSGQWSRRGRRREPSPTRPSRSHDVSGAPLERGAHGVLGSVADTLSHCDAETT